MALIKFQSLAFQSEKFPSFVFLQQTSPKVFMASSSPPSSKVTGFDNQKNKKPLSLSHRQPRAQVTHSLPPEKLEIFESMKDWTRENVLIHLKPVEKCWQPQNLLPDPSSDGFLEQLADLRERAKEIPDDFYVVLVGDMITEEAVPMYQSMLNMGDGIGDETGSSPNPWAVWIRGWTAEENRHGDLLNKYLYLSGRVDMGKVEKTIHFLLRRGMDIQTENNPFLGFIYTSFQERATFVSHSNTARLAKHYGDNKLARICGTIASDEKRHETAYTKLMEKLFQIDPDTSVLAFCDMMKKKITMPAHLMFDGQDHNLFNHFSGVARRTGIYTAGDYADILEHLVQKWNVEKLTALSSEGRQAQDFVCQLGPRIRRIEEKVQQTGDKTPVNIPFSWIFNREATI